MQTRCAVIIISTVMTVAAHGQSGPSADIRLPQSDALRVRELQLAICQAALTQATAKANYDDAQKTIEQARPQLEALWRKLEKDVCRGGRLLDDLTCRGPAKPEAQPNPASEGVPRDPETGKPQKQSSTAPPSNQPQK